MLVRAKVPRRALSKLQHIALYGNFALKHTIGAARAGQVAKAGLFHESEKA